MAQLTPIGERVEQLRRAQSPRLTQQELADAAGVTRQHLGRVLAGKADLKLRQWQFVADRLGIELRDLMGESAPEQWEPEPDVPDEGQSAQGIELEEYVGNMDRIVRTLRTTPGGALSIPLKLAILDAAKEAAEQVGATLPKEFYEIRRRVLTGEL